MGINAEILELVKRARAALALPPIRRLFMPDPEPSPDTDAEFGLIELADGSAGLYYAWMGESQLHMNERFAAADFIGRHPADVAGLYARPDEAERSIGLAAINAITQSIYRQARFELGSAGNSMGELALTRDDHLGMIGNFPSLVRRAEEQGIRLTVIERKAHMVREDATVRITLDPSALAACNKVISTAATLINDTLDDMLSFCTRAETIVVIGPSAGFIPDPLFARGVDLIGGTQVVDAELAVERLAQGLNLGPSARKFSLSKHDYPGFDELLRRAAETGAASTSR